jgi:hypothetical protein
VPEKSSCVPLFPLHAKSKQKTKTQDLRQRKQQKSNNNKNIINIKKNYGRAQHIAFQKRMTKNQQTKRRAVASQHRDQSRFLDEGCTTKFNKTPFSRAISLKSNDELTLRGK